MILHHLSDYCPAQSPTESTLRTVLHGGWCGVDLFFVLSGFLITGILLDTRSAPNYFRAFYARRTLRIFPVYYLTLIVVLLCARFAPAFAAVIALPHDQILYFLFLENWWVLRHGTWHANYIGHFWSLAVEEQFYLIWPFIVRRVARRQVEIVALFGIFFALFIRIGVFLAWGALRDIVENPFCRMDSLLMGALLASAVRRRTATDQWPKRLHWISLATAIAVAAGSFSNAPVLQVLLSPLFMFSALAIVFGGLVSLAFAETNVNSVTWKILCFPPLTLLGKYSYGAYVYHVPLLWLVARYAIGMKPLTSIPAFVLFSSGFLALTLAIAKLSFDCFESYFLKLKPKFTAQTSS